jgi:hypothetical protein
MLTDVSEKDTASIFRVQSGTRSSSTSVNMYNSTRRHIPADNILQMTGPVQFWYRMQYNSLPLYHTYPKSITCANIPHPSSATSVKHSRAFYLTATTHPFGSLRSIHIQPLLNLAPISMHVYAPSGTNHPGAIYPYSSTSCDQG